MGLIAEDLLLLLLDDESGALRASTSVPVALGGAVLAELALAGSVEVEEKTSVWRTARVHATGPAPADPVLVRAQEVVAEKQRSAADLVARLGKGLREELVARLVAQGMVEERKDRALGIFPRTRWPATESTHDAGLRSALADALLRGLDPDPRTGALVALLSAIDQAHRVVDHEGMASRDVRRRAQEVAKGQWAAKGVSDAIAAASAAVVAATTAATTTAITST